MFRYRINPFTGKSDMVGTSSTTPTLIQSMTTAQRVAYSAASGEVVWDTDILAIFRWDGNNWGQVGA